MLSTEAQPVLDKALLRVGSLANLQSLIMQNASAIAVWNIENARVFTKDGAIRGALDGRVDYTDGKPSKVRLEFEQQDKTWKVRSFNLGQ